MSNHKQIKAKDITVGMELVDISRYYKVVALEGRLPFTTKIKFKLREVYNNETFSSKIEHVTFDEEEIVVIYVG